MCGLAWLKCAIQRSRCRAARHASAGTAEHSEVCDRVDDRDACIVGNGAHRPVPVEGIKVPIRHAPLHPGTPLAGMIRARPQATMGFCEVFGIVPDRREVLAEHALMHDELRCERAILHRHVLYEQYFSGIRRCSHALLLRRSGLRVRPRDPATPPARLRRSRRCLARDPSQ